MIGFCEVQYGIDTTTSFQYGYGRAVLRITHDEDRKGPIQAFSSEDFYFDGYDDTSFVWFEI